MSFSSSSEDESPDIFPPSAPGDQPLDIAWANTNPDLDAEDGALLIGLSGLPGARFRRKEVARNLKDDLDLIVKEKVAHVFCLVTSRELRQFKVKRLVEAFGRVGLAYTHFPVEDGLIPGMEDLLPVLDNARELVEAGKRILVCCFGGFGRTGLFVAALQMTLNEAVTPERAIEYLRSVRGPRTIQSVKQYNFLMEFRAERERALGEIAKDDLSEEVSR